MQNIAIRGHLSHLTLKSWRMMGNFRRNLRWGWSPSHIGKIGGVGSIILEVFQLGCGDALLYTCIMPYVISVKIKYPLSDKIIKCKILGSEDLGKLTFSSHMHKCLGAEGTALEQLTAPAESETS